MDHLLELWTMHFVSCRKGGILQRNFCGEPCARMFEGIHTNTTHAVQYQHSLQMMLTRSRTYTLCASIPSTAIQLFPSLHSNTDQISTWFCKALILFRQCHVTFDKNNMDDEETVELCKDYCMHLTTCQNIILHLQPRVLKNSWHTTRKSSQMPQKTMNPWLQICKVRFGLLDEQGAESIHAKLNTLKSNY